MMYTLYVKTHEITGLKYLGYTSYDPLRYSGSGKDWKIHLKKHGKLINTEILLQSEQWNDIVYWGRYYSDLWQVTSAQDDFGNRIWANRIPETGGGGWTYVNLNKLGDRTGAKLSDDQKKNVANGRKSVVTDADRKKYSERVSGEKNPNYKNEVIKFLNLETKYEFVGTRIEFSKFSGLTSPMISSIITGAKKSYRKWTVK